MNNKVLYGLGIVFIILFVVAFLPQLSEIEQLSFLSASSRESKEVLEDIDKITFSQSNEESVVLTRQNGDWLVGDYKADLTQVNNLLSDLNTIQLDTIVSTNPDRYQTYGASDSATVMKIESADGPSQELLIGTRDQQLQSTYVRFVDSKEVYQISADLQRYSSRDLDSWRDKVLVDAEIDSLTELTLNRDGKTISLVKNDQDQWQALLGEEVRTIGEAARDRLFDQFEPLEGFTIARDDQKELFENAPKQTVTLVSDDGTETIVSFAYDEEGEIWLISSDQTEEIYGFPVSGYAVIFDTTYTLFE